MAGLTMHSHLTWKDESYEITVEPFVSDSRKVIGTVGMIRKAKQAPEAVGVEHLQFPSPQDYTQALKPMGSYHKTRKIEIGPHQAEVGELEESVTEEEFHRNIPASTTSPIVAQISVLTPVSAIQDELEEIELVEEEENLASEELVELDAVSGDQAPSGSMRNIEIGPPSMLTVPIATMPSSPGVRQIEIGPPDSSSNGNEISRGAAEVVLATIDPNSMNEPLR